MHRSNRLISAAVLIALSGALAGCGGMGGWDPTDMLDFLDTKKKLPGDRKPVFPEGVPGLEQGVPKQLYKGAAQEEPPPQQEVAAAPTADPKGKRGAKAKSKPVAPASDADAPPEEDGSMAAAPPAPKAAKPSRRRVTTPPADDQSAFPAPVQSGTFSR